ncbi:hypothetical protein BV25DRAFT_1915710 [Artomyces pyxidatus]|uniref:Uncharacterized protein n=1 Tax=Artomyces pyxidatus TaxID=48021 RepID=A0ACB8T383_9AGAM|nr:hypothetical protein BV25DRAFT_1915710 [Artomyces pyxidatus]
MAPSLPPGEARPSPKPQPIGSFPFILLLTTSTLCLLFILWRRSNALRTVVAHQLKTWGRREGDIRLSEDDGPPAHSFLEDEFDDDNDGLEDAPLALRAELLGLGSTSPSDRNSESPSKPPPSKD